MCAFFGTRSHDYQNIRGFGNIFNEMAPNISELPDELLLQIFSHFSPEELCRTIAPVCYAWWMLIKDLTFWKHLNIGAGRNKKVPNYCMLLKRCHPTITLKVKLPVTLHHVIDGSCVLPNLKKLDLRHSLYYGHIKDVLRAVESTCPNLECLSLPSCEAKLKGVSQVNVLPNLRSLNLNACYKIDTQCIHFFARTCRRLEHLDISEADGITDACIRALCKYRSATLLHLQVQGCYLTDKSLIYISSCEALQTLEVTNGCQFSETGLLALSSIPNLKTLYLGLEHNIHMSSGVLQKFFLKSQLESLEELAIECSKVDDKLLICLSKSCQNMRSLFLSNVDNITDLGFQPVLESRLKVSLTVFIASREMNGEYIRSKCRSVRFFEVCSTKYGSYKRARQSERYVYK